MSLIRHPKKFYSGLGLLVAFAVLFWMLFLPLFHDSDGHVINALEWTESVFNRLSKGSSWFVPEVEANIRAAGAIPVSLKIKMPYASQARVCLAELAGAGITDMDYEGEELSFSGNLAPVLLAATRDAAELYNNEGAKITARYGVTPLLASSAWWNLLNPAIRELQKQGRQPVARLVEEVVKKAIEPGNNFYGMPTAKVEDNILLVCGLLAFYVIYAIWYGFAIYSLFAGMGLLGKGEARENVEESEI